MLIFVESPKRPSKLIFVVLNFVTAGTWHCTSDDVINTRDLLCYYLQKLGQLAEDRRICYQLDNSGYYCLLILGSVGHAATIMHDVFGHAHHRGLDRRH